MTTNNQGVGTREIALMILLEIERGEKSHIVLRQVLEKYQYLSKQDRAFLTRLAEGTTERRILRITGFIFSVFTFENWLII